MATLNGSSREGRLKMAWAACAALVAVLLLETIDGTLTRIRGGDGPSYVLLARAIAEGAGYSDVIIPGAPHHTQYPPLLPLILAPFYYFFGYNFLWMQLVGVAFAMASVFAARSFFSFGGSRLTGILIAVLTGTNFYFLSFSREILAEIPYLFFSLLALYYLKKRSAEGCGYASYALVLPALVTLAVMTRMIGVTLIGAAIIYQFINAWGGDAGRKKELKKASVFAVAVLIPFAVWTIRNSLLSEGVATYQSIIAQADYYSLDSGAAGLGALAGRVYKNLGYYMDGVTKTLVVFTPAKRNLPDFVMFLFFLTASVGFLHELLLKRDLKDFYTLLYLALLSVWPVYGSGDARRYLVPLIPFIYFYFLSGVNFMRSLRYQFLRKGPLEAEGLTFIAATALLVLNLAELRELVLPGQASRNILRTVERLKEGLPRKIKTPSLEEAGMRHIEAASPCFARYMEAAERLKGALGKDDVVMARKPEILAIITGGYAVRFPYTKDSDAMEAFVRDKKVSYILIDSCYSETATFVVPYILSRSSDFKAVLTDSQGTTALRLVTR